MSKTPDRRRGQIVPKSPGKFLLRVNLGTTSVLRDDGTTAKKRNVRSEVFEGTKAEAEVRLTRVLGRMDAGTQQRTTKATVTEAAHEWLAGRASISARTRYNYQQIIDTHIVPSFLGTRLKDLTRAQVQHWITSRASQYSPATLRQAHTALRLVCELAVIDGSLPSNPCQYVEIPKLQKIGGAKVLDMQQMTALIERMRGDKHGLLFTVMLLSALRPQEALALHWQDITTVTDPRTGEVYPALSITSALTMVSRGRWEVGPVKTTAGRRLVPLPIRFAGVFQTLRQQQGSPPGSAFVFPNDLGSHQNLDTIYDAWVRTLKRYGLPHVKLYGTRHSSLTALMAAGTHPKVAAERAGHSKPATTLEVYSHVLPSMQIEALLAFPATMTDSLSDTLPE